MNWKTMCITLFLLAVTAFAQQAIQPYPGGNGETEAVPTAPLLPPIVSQGILIIGGIIIFLGFFAGLVIVLLIVLRMVFPPKQLPSTEESKKNRIAECKSWNGTNLNFVGLAGDTRTPPSTIGYCSGFKSEGKFDYITYHTGLPGYLFPIKKLKGESFQLHIPFIDITIPPDHIIQIEPELHGAPGRMMLIFASGLVPVHSGYEAPNTSNFKIRRRMEMERAETIAKEHGRTASLLPELAEKLWESDKQHFKKREAEPSRSSGGR